MLPLVAAVGVGFLDFDGEGFAAHLVPIDGAAGGSHVGGALVVGSHQDGEGAGNRLRHLAVDE